MLIVSFSISLQSKITEVEQSLEILTLKLSSSYSYVRVMSVTGLLIVMETSCSMLLENTQC